MDATSAASAAAATASAAAKAQTKLTSNFDTFLTLLTAQLKNQDPLSPMDSSQFTQQLVQFSTVEQEINANQNLESLIALTKARSGADAVNYLGKTLTLTDGSAPLQNGEAKWAYSLSSTAATARFVVTDARNHVVYSGDAETSAGAHEFTWNGEDNFGNTQADGTYTLTVTAKAAGGSTISTDVSTQGVIDGVDLTGSEPMLLIGPMHVPLSKATLLSED